ncbi:MAG: FMN reductase [Microbacteriaceae bacterium]|nr:FMN reductase [Microbacteriaceae bacterium]
MKNYRIVALTAGLNSPSSSRLLSDRIAEATKKSLEELGNNVSVETFELRDYAHDIVNNLLTGFAPPKLETMINSVVSADGLIAVTPIFSTGYSGIFKSFFDILEPDALQNMPVILGANAGTQRHSLAIDYNIRPLFNYLKALSAPTGVFAASSDWGADNDSALQLQQRIDRAVIELTQMLINPSAPKPDKIAEIQDEFDPNNFNGSRSFGHMLGGLAGE